MDREEGGIAVLTGTKVRHFSTSRDETTPPTVSQVVGMDTKNGSISLAGGHVISYDKCLLATGGRPRMLPLFSGEKVEKHVSVYREVRGCVN